MKCVIRIEAGRGDRRQVIEVDYDSTYPDAFWLMVRAPGDLKPGDPGRVDSRAYKLVVGEKGGLSLK